MNLLRHRVAELSYWSRVVTVFGDKTLLAVRIRASNNINDNSSQGINCWATRKLPIWDSETGWSTPQATRNPVWACIDIFKSSYGGRLTDDFLDLVGLKALADDFDSLGITFDWIFDQKITVWEAAQTVLAVGRSIPLLDGSQIIAIRDDAKEIPNYIFHQHNILKGSFDYSIKLPGQDDNDGLEVTYQSENDRTDETVICLLEDDPNPPENPERIRIPGITNRDKAYQLGLHLRAKRRYHTRNLKIQTGSEGHLPLFGSKIAVAHDMFENHGTGSFVQSIASDGKTIELFEPVSFNEEDIYQIVIRDKLGDLIGPYLVTKGDSNKTIVTNEEIPQEDLNRIYFDPEFEPPLVIFGKNNPWSKQFTVVRVESVEDGNFEIIGVNYTDEIYSFDDLTAPPIESNSFQKDSDIPSISNLNVRQITNTLNQAIATWVPFPGVRAYIIEQSFDQKESWETMGQTATNFFTFQPIPGRMDIRLSAVNKGQSDFLFWSGVLGSVRGIDDAGNSISDDAGNIAIE